MKYSEKPVNTIAMLYSYLLHVGGVETHLLSLLYHSGKSRYRWLVVAPTSPEFAAQARAHGAHVMPWEPAHALDVVALMRLVYLLRAHHVDLLHIHSPRAAIFGRIAARLLRLPVVVTVHIPSYYFAYGQSVRACVKRWFYRCVERILNHRFTDRLIYVSSHVYQEALASNLVPCGRATVIENGIDLTLFADNYQKQTVREACGTPLEATVLCCVGRLDRQKGIDILLEAIWLLEPQKRALHVWLVGDGPQRAVLEAQSRQLELEASVQFLGFRNDVPNLLKASDIFVLPSRYEAMPVSILEAMAAGLPCVVTDVGDNAEVVEDGVTGRVVPVEHPRALVAALNDLVLNAVLRGAMGDAARKKAQRYDVKLMVDRTLVIYDQVLR